MKLYSTKDRNQEYSLKEAVLQGLAPDGGLFMPTEIPSFPPDYWYSFYDKSFKEVCLDISRLLLSDALTDSDIQYILSTLNFEAPLTTISDNISVLELFHGPSLAFKDFGAQFMAQLMSLFNRDEKGDLTILVATSGDTGGAVASGFYDVEGINVVILYPQGKVSELQARQLTTFGKNIQALEVQGTFDDCQQLVKQAFVDESLKHKVRLSSANSINIARLIPQSFYYFGAFAQLDKEHPPITVSVPSGNFGNLTAGLMAKRMGLPIDIFIASTNINDVVPQYLETSEYQPKPSVETLSNAMDVGSPSNFERMQELYGFTWNHIKQDIIGYSFDDDQTIRTIKSVYEQHKYILDPHAAVAFLGMKQFLQTHQHHHGIILATAHYSKFKSTIDLALEFDTDLHPSLANLLDKTQQKEIISSEYEQLKSILLDKYAVN